MNAPIPPAGISLPEKTLESGAKLWLQIADFEESFALHDAICRELIGKKLGAAEESDEQLGLKRLFASDLTAVKDMLLSVISSRAVRDALFVCMAKCLYQSPTGAPEKITKSTFGSEGARADFYPIAGEVAMLNLRPFFKNLTLPSWLTEALDRGTSSPPSATG